MGIVIFVKLLGLSIKFVIYNRVVQMNEKTISKQQQPILDVLEIFEKVHFNEAPLNIGSVAYDKSLNLENNNSLALMARYSIENGLPIPKNMLSHSEDAFQSQEQSQHQKQPEESHFKIQAGAEDHLINTLNLGEFVFQRPQNQAGENTKNVLRNFGNAQNHYILYHRKARGFLKLNISNLSYFDEWVRSLKLQNFENFKLAWSPGQNKLFTRLYKSLCWEFYTQNAIPYVLSSRIKKHQTRNSHLRYIYRFLQGLRNPQDFTYFRKP